MPVVTKFYEVPPGAEGTKNCSNTSDHLTNMAVMLMYGKILNKFSPEPFERLLLYVASGTAEIVQIMTFGLL